MRRWLSTVPQFLYICTTYSEIDDNDSDDDGEELLADGERVSEDDEEDVEQE